MTQPDAPMPKRRTAKERRQGQTVEAVQARGAEPQLPARQQADRLARDDATLQREVAAASDAAVARPVRRERERRRAKLQERELRLLERDDAGIRLDLARRSPLTAILSAEHSTAVDELLWFLSAELDLLPVFARLVTPATRADPKPGKRVNCRTNYDPLLLNLLGLVSRYQGADSGPAVTEVLLTDPRWMHLFGFNLLEVAQGACRRSTSLCGKTRDEAHHFVEPDDLGPVRTRLTGPRGALSSQTLAAHERALSADLLQNTFNAVIAVLAARGYFAPEVRGVLDSTGLEVVPSFPGAGVVRKDVKVDSKARKPQQLKVSVRGFKVWYLMDVATGIPLACHCAPIQTSETVPAKALVVQAQENLGAHARLVSLAVDRGFLDGDFLWWLKDQRHVDWVCPAKALMLVTAEARQRVTAALAALARPQEAPLATAQRAARQGRAHDGVSFVQRTGKPGRAPLVLAQVEDLHCTDFYGPGGSAAPKLRTKAFQPTPLHATVVLSWPDRRPEEQQDEQTHDPEAGGAGPVVLLSPLPEAGFRRFDRYDERSLIENRVNRDAKQSFALGTTLARNPEAFLSATVFSTLAIVFHRALALHHERMDEVLERRGESLGVLRYRRQCARENWGLILIVVGDRYGLIPMTEFAQLAGFTFR
jgi:hypothetical protein